MRTIPFVLILIVIVLPSLLTAQLAQQKANEYWPFWRGPLQTGESPTGKPPLEWSEDQHVRWKREIPGKGLSSPVIWGDLIFLTTAVEMEKKASEQEIKAQKDTQAGWMKMSRQAASTEFYLQYVVMAIQRSTGKIAWQKIVHEGFPHEGRHVDGSWASESCVTDGKYIIAPFGSDGYYCFDLTGTLLWQTDLGDMRTSAAFGEGSSPTIYGDFVVINWDHEIQSFITVLDIKTGKQVWKVNRDEDTSWATPVVAEVNGAPQIITAATNKSRGYNLKDGTVIWELGGLTGNVIPSPMYYNGVAWLMSGFRGNVLQAIKLTNASGDLEKSNAMLWTLDKATPYVPSGCLYQGNLYFLKGNRESLTCLDAATGAIHYTKQELEQVEGVYASPVAANGRVYIAGRNGVTVVIKAGPEFEVLATNIIDDAIDASPAIVGRELYIRGQSALYCIAE
ncbi:PQQ-binding-like beta-propeller repeat protein [candidate division KSB1 bacterium]|nr:PQQ-binding-like beta-propeller repeat protein [candidate division KSB1 bacterium]